MLTLGGKHAPIKEAYDWWLDAPTTYRLGLEFHCNGIIPGFGSSFIKGKSDEKLHPISQHLFHHYPEWYDIIAKVKDSLHQKNKIIFPNLACYTAITAIILEVPRRLCDSLVLEARLPEWINILRHEQH